MTAAPASAPASADERPRTDEELVSAFGNGDLEALSALYDRHASLAYGLALRITGDGAQAEEAVQSAFMCLWKGCSEAGGGADPVRLRVVRLVARAALDNHRRQDARPSAAPVDPPRRRALTHPSVGLARGS